MTNDQHSTKLEGVAVARIVERSTGKTLGWVYRWNNGEVSKLWLRDKKVYVDVVPISHRCENDPNAR